MFKNCDTQHSNVLIRANSQPQLHFILLDIQAPPFQVGFFFFNPIFFHCLHKALVSQRSLSDVSIYSKSAGLALGPLSRPSHLAEASRPGVKSLETFFFLLDPGENLYAFITPSVRKRCKVIISEVPVTSGSITASPGGVGGNYGLVSDLCQ